MKANTLLDWILARLGVVVFVLIFVSQIVRGLIRARRDRTPPHAKPDELEAQRRAKEIQQDIRRRRAQREAPPAPTTPPRVHREPMTRPVPRTETTQMPEPFGGTIRRVLEELQRQARPEPPPPPLPPALAPAAERRHSELERQEQLANQLRALEDARALAERRAVNVAAEKSTQSQLEPALRLVARDSLLADLHDPAS